MTQHEAEGSRSRKKLAIVSTYNENCGNASYTHVLKVAFSRYVDVDVIPLDLFLLQSTASSVIPAGDDHIRDICRRLAEYDYVNIQYEAGLYGARIPDMLRRLKMLVDAAPNVTVTLHRVEYEKTSFWRAVKLGFAARSYRRFRMARGAAVFSDLSKAIVRHCAKAAKKKNVRIKVHTRRDRRTIQQIYKFEDVYDYPLAFLTPAEQAEAQAHHDRTSFLKKYGFEPGDKVIGLFGYLSNYKGIETAIESLKYLPKEYKLALFGSQHPQSVKRGEVVNPYLKSLFDLMEDVDSDALNYRRRRAHVAWLERRDATSEPAPAPQQAVDDDRVIDRVRFIGSLPDPEFMEALRLTDVVVLPYQEVGQSMSGVAVLAMECGSKMICANNHSFFETRRYFRDCFANFDVGNAYELAQKVRHCASKPELFEFYENRQIAFAKYNIDGSVTTQLRNFGHVFAQEQK